MSTFTTSFDQHGRDHQLRHSHRSTLVVGCKRCPETGVNDVLSSDTPSDTVTTPTRRANRDADDLGGGVVDHLQSKRGVQCCQLRWIGAIEQLSDVSESVDYFRDLLLGQDAGGTYSIEIGINAASSTLAANSASPHS